jgi:hypothetical protein
MNAKTAVSATNIGSILITVSSFRSVSWDARRTTGTLRPDYLMPEDRWPVRGLRTGHDESLFRLVTLGYWTVVFYLAALRGVGGSAWHSVPILFADSPRSRPN